MSQEKRKEEDLPALRQCWHIDTINRGLYRKARMRTDYSHQKQYEQHDDQPNDINEVTKIVRKKNCKISLND